MILQFYHLKALIITFYSHKNKRQTKKIRLNLYKEKNTKKRTFLLDQK